MSALLAALLAPAVIVAAAKAHGREVRLERERAGHREVVFGGDNPPSVEALWRRDRIRFWTTFAVLAALAALAAHAWSVPVAAPWRGGDGWSYAVAGVAWPFAGAFIVAGLASLAQKATVSRDRRELRGSLAWWTVAAALAVADAWLLGL